MEKHRTIFILLSHYLMFWYVNRCPEMLDNFFHCTYLFVEILIYREMLMLLLCVLNPDRNDLFDSFTLFHLPCSSKNLVSVYQVYAFFNLQWPCSNPVHWHLPLRLLVESWWAFVGQPFLVLFCIQLGTACLISSYSCPMSLEQNTNFLVWLIMNQFIYLSVYFPLVIWHCMFHF